MAIDINQIARKYFFKDKPVDYKLKCGEVINIYPILVEDWDEFEENYDILCFEKNKIPIPEIIQMSYLQFIIEVVLKKEEINQNKLYNIFKICLKLKEKNDIKFGYEKNKPILVICDNEYVKYKINSKDFDEIKKIILYQNILGYDDSVISADIQKIINEYYKAKNGNIEFLNLEDKMAFLGNNSGLTKNQMLKMTYREFSKRYEWAVDQMDYQINKTAEMSGNVKFEKKVEHLIYKKKKNKYEQFCTDEESFKNKINNIQ